MVLVETLIGRQPIFDRDLAVKGYDLLFRPLEAPTKTVGLLTPERVLGQAADEVGTFVGSKRAFCHASDSVISGEAPILVPPERVVLTVGGPGTPDDTAWTGLRRLHDRGYRLAIEDFEGSDRADQLFELASIAKIDPEAVDRERLPDLMQQCRRFKVQTIAQNVDTPAKLGRCEALGFDYFQGYLLARPHAVTGGALAPGRLAGLRVSARLLDTECPVTVLEDIIRGDPAMSHQLLQLAGTGARGEMKRTVTTIRQALVLVGWRRLQSWVALLLLTDDATTSDEAIAAVLMRARMSELLAVATGCQPDAGYTAGLVSTLDIVLNMPTDKIIEELPLDAEIRDAILSGQGPLGRLVADVADYQLGCLELAVRSGLVEEALRAAAVAALTWAVGMAAVLDPG